MPRSVAAPFSKRLMPTMVVLMPTLVVCTLATGWQLARHLGNLSAAYPEHGWVVTSFVVVAVMTIVAIGVLEPAGLAVLFELKQPEPNGELIDSFLLAVKWALPAYFVTAGILEYVVVNDGTRGSMLVLLTLSIFVFAVDIPILFGFSVARFQTRREAT